MKPYLLLSDIHAHLWSTFDQKTAEGSARLQIILDEIQRAADELQRAGGEMIVIAGDIFHVRGKIEPSVFNPVARLFQELINTGFTITAIPGNHDLESRDTTEIGNAFQSFNSMIGFDAVTQRKAISIDSDNWIAFVPWQSTLDALRAEVKKFPTDRVNVDLVIHAGIDGVIAGMPEHGLSSAEVASWGFKRVFAGHYHNHKVMEDGKVISIGATTHQTWGDIGSKAGYLLVYPDRIQYCASRAPSFVEVDETTDKDDLFSLVNGNYVRIRGLKLTDDEVKAWRKLLVEEYGARGVIFQVTREKVSVRATPVVSKALSLDASIAAYVDTLGEEDAEAIKADCQDILTTIRSVAA